MNWQLLLAGLIALVGGLGHAFDGERRFISALLKSDIPLPFKTAYRSVWHVITLMMLAAGVILLLSGISNSAGGNLVLVQAIAVAFVLWAAVWLVIIVTTDSALLTRLPFWILMILVAVLGWWGASVIGV